MSQPRRFLTFLPLVLAVVSALVVNAIPVLRAVVLREEAFMDAGWAFYFITLPGGFIQLVVGGITSASLTRISSERTHAVLSYSVTTLIALTCLAMLVFVCQPA